MTANTLWRQNGDDETATAKRVKIGLGPSMKESDDCSEVDLVSPEGQVLPLNGDGDVGDPPEEIKLSKRYTNGNPPAPKIRSIFSHSLYEQQPFLLDYTASNDFQR